VKFLCALASALFCVSAPVAAPAQSPDLSLISALCSDDYHEDTAGQCSVISADGEIFILTQYGVVIAGETDEDVIVLYLDDLEDTPVGSIQPRREDAVATDDKPNAEPANRQETIASRVMVLEAPSAKVERARTMLQRPVGASRRPPRQSTMGRSNEGADAAAVAVKL
jgi:hypothetical protein